MQPVERQAGETVQLPIPNQQWTLARNRDFSEIGIAAAPSCLPDTTIRADSGKLSVLLCRLLC